MASRAFSLGWLAAYRLAAIIVNVHRNQLGLDLVAFLAQVRALHRRMMPDGLFFQIGIREDLVLVIPHDDLVPGPADDILRQKRYLAAAARRVDHVIGNCQPGSMAAKPVHDLQPFAHRGAEMVRPFGDVGLVQVIRPNAHGEKLADELEHHVGIVVHALHQHRLVPDGDSGVGEHAARALRFWRALPRMVEVRVDVDRVIFLQKFAELGRDALRQYAGHLRPQTDDLHMGNFPQSFQNAFEEEIRQHERVAAGHDHIPYLRVRSDIVDAALDVLHVDLGGVAHFSFPGAEPAIHRALAGAQEEHAVGIPVNDARHGAVGIFCERVFRQAVVDRLFRIGNALEPDRIAWIANQTQVVWIDARVEQFVELFGELLVKTEALNEVFAAIHALS